MIDKLLDQIMQQGLSISLLVIAVVHLKGKISECERDRQALWDRLFSLQQNKNQ
jgi:hypothetical protein